MGLVWKRSCYSRARPLPFVCNLRADPHPSHLLRKDHDSCHRIRQTVSRAKLAAPSRTGNAEDSIDMQGREKDDEAAHGRGGSEKTAAEQIADLQKQLKDAKDAKEKPTVEGLDKVLEAIGAVAKKVDEQGTALNAVKKDVDEKLSKLEDGPLDKAKNKNTPTLVLDDKHKTDENKDGKGNPLSVNKETASKGRGVFA